MPICYRIIISYDNTIWIFRSRTILAYFKNLTMELHKNNFLGWNNKKNNSMRFCMQIHRSFESEYAPGSVLRICKSLCKPDHRDSWWTRINKSHDKIYCCDALISSFSKMYTWAYHLFLCKLKQFKEYI